MKRLTAILLLCTLFLSGCGDTLKEPVTFYYLNSNYEEEMASVIGTEQREASGHRDDLMYLMALYLMGPATEELQSPLPQGTTIRSAEQHGPNITICLSDLSGDLTDARFTLAYTCLALTCLDLTDATKVTINSGDHSITLDLEDLLLQDLITPHLEES